MWNAILKISHGINGLRNGFLVFTHAISELRNNMLKLLHGINWLRNGFLVIVQESNQQTV